MLSDRVTEGGRCVVASARRICDGLAFMGLQLDHDRNMAVSLRGQAAPQIQAYGSRIRVLVTETAEQRMIARETATALAVRTSGDRLRLPIAVSARHVHLSLEAVDALFGTDYVLNQATALRQPGHWVAKERITLVGPKGKLERVAILGPLRPRTQIEVSRTDSFALGVEVPVRDSGKLEATPLVTIEGPFGTFTTDGLIIAARHIHTNPVDAKRLSIADGEYVDVRVGDHDRALTFGRTVVRVGDNAFHGSAHRYRRSQRSGN